MNYLQHAYQTYNTLYYNNLASNNTKQVTIYRYLSGIFLNNLIIAFINHRLFISQCFDKNKQSAIILHIGVSVMLLPVDIED